MQLLIAYGLIWGSESGQHVLLGVELIYGSHKMWPQDYEFQIY